MKVNSLDYWVKKNLSKIKESNLHRTLVEISSSMGPEVVINKKSC